MATSMIHARPLVAHRWRMILARAAIIVSCVVSACLTFIPMVLLVLDFEQFKVWIFGPPRPDFVEAPFATLVIVPLMLLVAMLPCIIVTTVLRQHSGMSRRVIVLTALTLTLLMGAFVISFPHVVNAMLFRMSHP